MKLPYWVSWAGLAEHLLIGALVMLIGIAHHWIPAGSVSIALWTGLVHEQAQQDCSTWQTWSDFRKQNGGPWNGACDVLAFMVPSLIWWVC